MMDKQAQGRFENFMYKVVQDEKGKIIQKTETWPREQNVFKYAYDTRGRLAKVYRNNRLVESYTYNYLGQRVQDSSNSEYKYTERGQLYAAGGLAMRYDEFGQIWSREQNMRSAKLEKRMRDNPESVSALELWGRIKFNYEGNRLVGVVLPNMDRIRYEYQENGIMPVRIYCDNRLAWECRWRKNGAPQQMINRIQDTTYTWLYQDEDSYSSVCVFIEGDIIKKLGLASGTWGAKKERFFVGLDQVGSVRTLINSKGNIVKRIDYDSFGNVLSDSQAKLFIPQGFAGGMTDPYTGLTKFGHRYYDPKVGRFTSLDPAKDRRGDNDLYDYCADDPINRVDRTGLRWKDFPGAGQLPDMMYEVDVMNQAEVKKYYDQKALEEKYKFDNVAREATKNLSTSIANEVKDTFEAVVNPANTAWNMSSFATGSIGSLFGADNEYTRKTNAFLNKFFGTFLSGPQHFMDQLMERPVQVISDLMFLKSANNVAKTPSKELNMSTSGNNTSKTSEATPIVTNKSSSTTSPPTATAGTTNSSPTATNKFVDRSQNTTNSLDKLIDFSNARSNSSNNRKPKLSAEEKLTLDLGVYSNNADKNAKENPNTVLSSLATPNNITNGLLPSVKKKEDEKSIKTRGIILR